jgi:hypothetical protein
MESIERQLQIFGGCIYWPDINRIQIPNGRFLDKKRFNVWFGDGRRFALDRCHEQTTKSAWIAFTRNSGFHPPTRWGKP